MKGSEAFKEIIGNYIIANTATREACVFLIDFVEVVNPRDYLIKYLKVRLGVFVDIGQNGMTYNF